MKTSQGRPKSFDEDEVLALAMHYFWEHGYENTSLDNLLLAMGIKKSSFYHTFKSKEELFSRTLKLYGKIMLGHYETLKTKIGPKMAILALSDAVLKELKETGKIKGCLLMNSSKECYNRHSGLSQLIEAEFNFFLEMHEKFIKEAQEQGEISKQKDAKKLAGRYLSAFNGLMVTIQAGASQEIIEDIRVSLHELLE
jgi:TetR/AcrR family transcriptional regulator, transcriptional repressor for nem operon